MAVQAVDLVHHKVMPLCGTVTTRLGQINGMCRIAQATLSYPTECFVALARAGAAVAAALATP
jgi:hypothetical protein